MRRNSKNHTSLFCRVVIIFGSLTIFAFRVDNIDCPLSSSLITNDFDNSESIFADSFARIVKERNTFSVFKRRPLSLFSTLYAQLFLNKFLGTNRYPIVNRQIINAIWVISNRQANRLDSTSNCLLAFYKHSS